MWKVTISLILIFSGFQPSLRSQCADSVNIYSFQYDGHSYEVVREMKNWATAAACAVQRGGHLVTIEDSAEQSAIYDTLINKAGVSSNYTTVPDGGGVAYVWIGATDQMNEGQWLWDGNNDSSGVNFWTGQGAAGSGNGSPVSGAYYNWGGKGAGMAQEPDNFQNNQHYAGIGLQGWPSGSGRLGQAGEWNDIDGSNQLYYIIEIDTVNLAHNADLSEPRIDLYPQPADELLRAESDLPIEAMALYDSQGRQILHSTDPRLEVAELPAGLYFLHLEIEGRGYQRKIMIR